MCHTIHRYGGCYSLLFTHSTLALEGTPPVMCYGGCRMESWRTSAPRWDKPAEFSIGVCETWPYTPLTYKLLQQNKLLHTHLILLFTQHNVHTLLYLSDTQRPCTYTVCACSSSWPHLFEWSKSSWLAGPWLSEWRICPEQLLLNRQGCTENYSLFSKFSVLISKREKDMGVKYICTRWAWKGLE